MASVSDRIGKYDGFRELIERKAAAQHKHLSPPRFDHALCDFWLNHGFRLPFIGVFTNAQANLIRVVADACQTPICERPRGSCVSPNEFANEASFHLHMRGLELESADAMEIDWAHHLFKDLNGSYFGTCDLHC